jgi:S1-C subfamily serine protease
MRRALLALLLVLAGCTEAPTLAEREASFEPFEGRTVGAETLRRFMHARTALLITGLDDDEQPLRRLDGVGQVRFGAAAALTSDGYFLTVAHCVRQNEPVWLGVPIRGDVPSGIHWGVVRARVVWSGDPAVVDLALLKAPATDSGAFAWADPRTVHPGSNLATVGFGGTDHGTAETWRIDVIAGHALEAVSSPSRPAADGPSIATIDYEGPIWRGDSGGALTTLAGDLLGVNDCIVVTAFSRHNVALRPDPGWIAAAIDRDRRAHP